MTNNAIYITHVLLIYQIDGRLLRYLPSNLPVSIHHVLPCDIELLIHEPVDEPEEEPVVSYLFVWELQT